MDETAGNADKQGGCEEAHVALATITMAARSNTELKGQGPGLVNVLWVEAYRNNAIPDDLLSDVGDPTQTLPIASLSLGASVKAAEPVVPP